MSDYSNIVVREVKGKAIDRHCQQMVDRYPYTAHCRGMCARWATFKITYDYRGNPSWELLCTQHARNFCAVRQYEKLRAEFAAARDEWHKATSFMSNMGQAQAHHAYQSVILMGMPVVPIILRELQRSPDHWMTALGTITGEDPVKEEDWGRLAKMSAAWIEWGREKGLVL